MERKKSIESNATFNGTQRYQMRSTQPQNLKEKAYETLIDARDF
jgi:hypothetical protein